MFGIVVICHNCNIIAILIVMCLLEDDGPKRVCAEPLLLCVGQRVQE